MKVLMTMPSSMFCGSARSQFELAIKLLDLGADVLMVISKRGESTEQYLQNSRIPYVCIRQYNDWTYSRNQSWSMKFCIKNFIKQWLNFLIRLLNIKALIQTIRLIRKEDVDIVHIGTVTVYIPGWAGIICKIPVVWHIREFLEEDLGQTFCNRNRSVKMMNKASQMIAISNEIKAKWENFFSTPIKVIYNALPIEKYYVKKSIYLKEPVKIMICGRITPSKGQLFFFNGIRELMSKTDVKIQCYWAGSIEDQEYYKRIQDAIEMNGMSGYVSYLGEVSQMPPVLKDIDILCVCSSREGFGRVTIEGMMAGCCVLGADTGATPEIITNGETGYLYRYDDLGDFVKQLSFMLKHRDEMRMVAHKGQEYAVNKFSIERLANNVMQIYSDLLSK